MPKINAIAKPQKPLNIVIEILIRKSNPIINLYICIIKSDNDGKIEGTAMHNEVNCQIMAIKTIEIMVGMSDFCFIIYFL